jgi:hypothetical protein
MFPPGHFYSPVVDPADRHVRQALAIESQPPSTLSGIALYERTMRGWFRRARREYQARPFPAQPTPSSLYYYENTFFPLADALALRAFFRHARPQRFIEVGSGFSSCAAVDCNEGLLRGRGKLTFIDPHPERLRTLLSPDSRYHAGIEPTQLQDVPLDLFRSLRANDILFLDSSHVAKTGSDVVDYLFRIFPVLATGVLIHIHDIFFPFEYPSDWVFANGRSWNEAYLLRAFLTGNIDYRILFFSDWFYKCRRSLVAAQMPLCIEHRGGSLWLRKDGATKSATAFRHFFSR